MGSLIGACIGALVIFFFLLSHFYTFLRPICLSSKHGLIDSYDSLTSARSSLMSPKSNWKYEHVALLDIRMCCSFGRARVDKHARYNGDNDVSD